MKKLLVPAVALSLAAPLLAGVSASAPAQAATTSTASVKVLSYNIRGPHAAHKRGDKGYYSWQNRRARQVAMVLSNKPAIFGLQEASTNGTVRAKDYLVPKYAAAGYAAYVPGGGSPKLIFWKNNRFLKVGAGNVALPRSTSCDQSRGMGWVLLQERASGQRYWVGNTHFAVGDPSCLRVRNLSAAAVHRAIAATNPNNYPIILMGDFNNRQVHCYPTDAVRLGAPITRLAEGSNRVHSYNLDISASAGCRQTMHGNWPRAAFGKSRTRIDFLFHSKKLNVVNFKVDTRRNLPIRKNGRLTGTYTSASDHLPAVATFQRR